MRKETDKQFLERVERAPTYWQQIVLVEFLESLYAQMTRKGMRPVDLARRLGKSAGYVSRMLNGQENPTIANLIRFARSVDGVLHVHVADRNAVVEFRDRDFSTADVELVTFGRPDPEYHWPTILSRPTGGAGRFESAP